jgi:hypothetical protein
MAMMAVGITRPEKVGVASIDHTFAVRSNFAIGVYPVVAIIMPRVGICPLIVVIMISMPPMMVMAAMIMIRVIGRRHHRHG